MANTWARVGLIGVDSGLCWVGDPCYIRKGIENATGKSWDELFVTPPINYAGYQFKNGVDGLGVCVGTDGDGCYPVYVAFNDGPIQRIVVDFCGSFRIPRDKSEAKPSVARPDRKGQNGGRRR